MNNSPSRIASLLPKIRAGLVSALGRFPWMLLCGLTMTVTFIVDMERKGNPSDDFVAILCGKLLMTASLGMPLFFSLRMLRERIEGWRRWPVEVAGLPLLAGWFFCLGREGFDGPEIVTIRWTLLLAGLHFFAAVSAYVKGSAGNGFWQFNRRVFLRFCLATLYSGVLTVGLELALLSADKLFELKLENAYADLFFIMTGCFQPVFFLAGVPRDFAALELDSEHPRALKAFTQFALAPLVAVYTAILYAYALKIVAVRVWPHGWVALPVLILSGVGILSALLLYPLRAQPEEKWAGWFCRNFPLALAPLSLLLLLSVWKRIGAYGVTEERYLGIVAGGWILAWAMVFIFKKTAGIRWIPSSLAVICVLAAFGPWSAGTISEESQLRRLTHLLEAHGRLAGGKVRVADKETTLPANEYEDLVSTIEYLARIHGVKTMRGLFSGLFKEVDSTSLPRGNAGYSVLNKLKLVSESGVENRPNFYEHTLDDKNVSPVEGFKRVSFFNLPYNTGWNAAKKKDGALVIVLNDGALEAADGKGAPERLPLQAFIDAVPDIPQNGLPAQQMTNDFQRNGHAFRIIFTKIDLERKPGAHARIRGCSFLLLED